MAITVCDIFVFSHLIVVICNLFIQKVNVYIYIYTCNFFTRTCHSKRMDDWHNDNCQDNTNSGRDMGGKSS